MDISDSKKQKKKTGKRTTPNSKRANRRWLVSTVAMTFALSAAFSILSSETLQDVSLVVAVIELFIIIFIGILFDIVGVAVTTAELAPFHSMAASHVKGAKQAIRLIRSKEKVSNFCNDVVGDICGIISGSSSTVVIAYIIKSHANGQRSSFIAAIIVTSLVAAITVGGKAIGKSFAISQSRAIVFTVGKLFALLRIGNNRKRK